MDDTTTDLLASYDDTLRTIWRECRAYRGAAGVQSTDLAMHCRWCHMGGPDGAGNFPVHLPSCPAGKAEAALWPELQQLAQRSVRVRALSPAMPCPALYGVLVFLHQMQGNRPPDAWCATISTTGLTRYAWRVWMPTAHDALSSARQTICRFLGRVESWEEV